MTINTSKQAIAEALGQTKNVVGTCQMTVRNWFNAPSAGDQDGDGDADAIDGWLSEPVSARRYDRTPPAGKPVAFKNADGSGFGHRALSLPDGKFRSTDFDTTTQRYKAGVVGTANSLSALERSMGLVYLGWSLTIDGFPIPEPIKPPAREVFRRRFGHASLEVFDTDRQHTHDLEKLFGLGLGILTGTEAGSHSGNTPEELIRCAEKYDYALSQTSRFDSWVAVKRDNMVKGTFEKGSNLVIKASSEYDPKPSGKWGARGIVWAKYKDVDCGWITVGSIHLLTAKNAGAQIKLATDEEFEKKALTFGRTHGKGEQLVFLNADFNNKLKLINPFGETPFTLCWTELKVWPDTGHGTIDGIASWDLDGRVKCDRAFVRNDQNFFLHTDHFLVRADYEIKAPLS